MEQKKYLTLDNLRKTADGTDIEFRKSFRGYKKDDVEEYVKSLQERLQNAERSFKNKLEEIESISSMHKQESEKYLQLLKDEEMQISQLKLKVKALTDENEQLEEKLKEALENSVDINDVNKIKELESKVIQLNEQLDDMMQNNIAKDEYDIVTSENELLKQHYEKTLSENSMLTGDKSTLEDQNKRLIESLAQANERNKELREMITKVKLGVRKKIAESQAKIYEGSQKHQQNIEQITENLKTALSALQYEKFDLANLIETEEYNDIELDSTDQVKIELDT